MTLEEIERQAEKYRDERPLYVKWMEDPPLARNEPDWWDEVVLAVLEALVSHGVEAWDGDGVGCVTNMLYAISKKAERETNG